MTATALYQNTVRLLVALVVGTLAVLTIVTAVGATTHHGSTTGHNVEARSCSLCSSWRWP